MAINQSCKFPQEFLQETLKVCVPRVKNILKRIPCLKVNLIFEGVFVLPGKLDNDGNEISDLKTFGTKNVQLYRAVEPKPSLEELMQIVLKKVCSQ